MTRSASGYPECMRVLIEEFAKLPGIGTRTAERLAFYILSADKEDARRLSESILTVKNTIRYCKQCFNLSEQELCGVCSDSSRDRRVVCVVEEPKDILSIEKAGTYRGLYHVLLGSLSPLEGIGPQDLKMAELFYRLKEGGIQEVILATSSDTEGEATAFYLARLVKPSQIRVSRLAQGVPLGTDLEFADKATLGRAIETRREL